MRAFILSNSDTFKLKKAKRRAEMVGLNKAFTEGTRMEELTAAKTAPMTNGLSSKFSGGSMYTIKPVLSSADRYREARLHGEPMESTANDSGSSSASARTESGNASVFHLISLLAFGTAAALAIMEYPEHQSEIAQYLSDLKSFTFFTSTSDWMPLLEKESAEIMQKESLAKQPVWLQRQR